MAIATTKITDYSHTDYIPIMDGNVTIWDEYLGHMTNVTSYEIYADETKRTIDLLQKDHMKRILTTDLGHIDTLIATIRVKHRNKSSINPLGTALKVVAGTPDFDDWEQIRFRQEQLLESEKRQVEINYKLQNRLNLLTKTLNDINKADEIYTEHLFETMLAKNRIQIE